MCGATGLQMRHVRRHNSVLGAGIVNPRNVKFLPTAGEPLNEPLPFIVPSFSITLDEILSWISGPGLEATPSMTHLLLAKVSLGLFDPFLNPFLDRRRLSRTGPQSSEGRKRG